MGNRYLMGYQDIINGGYSVMDVFMRKDSKPEEELHLEDISKLRTIIKFDSMDELKRMADCLNDMVARWGNV